MAKVSRLQAARIVQHDVGVAPQLLSHWLKGDCPEPFSTGGVSSPVTPHEKEAGKRLEATATLREPAPELIDLVPLLAASATTKALDSLDDSARPHAANRSRQGARNGSDS